MKKRPPTYRHVFRKKKEAQVPQTVFPYIKLVFRVMRGQIHHGQDKALRVERFIFAKGRTRGGDTALPGQHERKTAFFREMTGVWFENAKRCKRKMYQTDKPKEKTLRTPALLPCRRGTCGQRDALRGLPSGKIF